MKQFNLFKNYFFIPAFLIYCAACSTSGTNTASGTSSYPRLIEKARRDKANFIMHSGVDTFMITSLVVEKNRKDFTVHLNKLDSLNRAIFRNAGNSAARQFRIYMVDSTSYTLDEPHTIPLSKIARIEPGN